jgi:hypothetical protein
MHVLKTNALPCEENRDIFCDENWQVYTRYNLIFNKNLLNIN